MATIYVSKSGGNDSNNGTSKATAVATLPYAFQLAAGTDNVIEVIDNSTYHPSGSVSNWLPGDNGGGQAWTNLIFKAGTDSSGNQVYPVLSGKNTNETGSVVGGNAIQYQAGWTVEGFEIRDFSTAAAVPNTGKESTLIFKNNIVHHMSSRNTGGSTSGVVDYSHDKGNATTNIVENCVFFEIGKYVIAGTCTEPVHIKNCLIASYGGTSGNNNAIKLNSTGSIVEHCIVTDYQGGSTVVPVDLTAKGQVNRCIFNKITTGMQVINPASAQSNAFANIGTAGSASYSNTADSAEHDQIYTANLLWNSASFDSITSEEIGQFLSYNGSPAYSYTSAGSDGVDQASGSTITGDLGDELHIRVKNSFKTGRKRTSSAANQISDIGCYEFYREFVPTNRVTSRTVGDDYIVNNSNTEQRVNEHTVRYDDVGTNPPPVVPFSKSVKGTSNLRRLGSSSPYKVTKGS